MLRVFLSSCSRPQTYPQQYSVASSCIGMLKSSAEANDFSTNSFPSTAFLISSPLSNVALSMFLSLSLVLHARPLLDDLGDRSEVGVGAALGLRDCQHLPHGGAGDHRHAQRLRLVDTQTHVLVREPRGESVIERARQDRAREFVLRCAVAAA